MTAAPPTTVDIGPHTYSVVLVPSGILKDANRAGQCNVQALVISVDAAQARSQVADTLLHEITHAILEAVGLDEDTEERVASAMGPGLLALLRDNPALVRWVTR
jgi:hypothetical protein